MEQSAMESISTRLSSIPTLYFPHSQSPSSPSSRQSSLLSLLSRDPSLFLERYGSHLTPSELHSFHPLTPSYEISFHLNRLKPEQPRSRSLRVKNRRRAYMDGLVDGGEYFSEDAMRERDPYLHWELLGRWQDPMDRRMARPGERWSETLLRRCEEVGLAERVRGEQRRRGVDEKEWVGMEEVHEQSEEEEEEEDEEEEDGEESIKLWGEEGMVEKTREEQRRLGEERRDSVENGEEEEEDGPPELWGEEGMVEKTRGEHRRLGEERRDSVENGEEEDEDGPPEEIRDRGFSGGAHGPVSEPFRPSLSAEEMEDHLDQFTLIMQQKFLAGEDTEHLDYSKIDDDERLDDHWIREANYDAEEKYFDED